MVFCQRFLALVLGKLRHFGFLDFGDVFWVNMLECSLAWKILIQLEDWVFSFEVNHLKHRNSGIGCGFCFFLPRGVFILVWVKSYLCALKIYIKRYLIELFVFLLVHDWYNFFTNLMLLHLTPLWGDMFLVRDYRITGWEDRLVAGFELPFFAFFILNVEEGLVPRLVILMDWRGQRLWKQRGLLWLFKPVWVIKA